MQVCADSKDVDEPTSGLDSQTAWYICSLLRRLADNGQAILCTIHQPSLQLFEMFDRLLLLERGGRTLYFGDIGMDAAVLTQYFENQGARSCADGENPAEWVLEVTGGRVSKTSIKWSDKWRDSIERQQVKHELSRLKAAVPNNNANKPGMHTEFAARWSSQLILITHRVFQEYWRDPVYL